MPQEVSVFMENRPGKLERVTELLAGAAVNIRAITIGDNGDFGVLKLLVDDPVRAREALAAGGVVAALKNVVAVRVRDCPGGLLEVVRALRRLKINLEDAYGFVVRGGEEAIFVFQVATPGQTARALEAEGFALLEESDLYRP
ncbi:MAG TPA: hypothetical protein PK636_00665 [bacterium]|nr:hypothetical protein [bacterium]HPJ71178.1 hypothetical protein [bacterium]HPQ67311.1 hypothetical protein [bacterium]